MDGNYYESPKKSHLRRSPNYDVKEINEIPPEIRDILNEHEEKRISPSKEKVIIIRDRSPHDSPGSKYILNRSIHEIGRFDNLEPSKNYVLERDFDDIHRRYKYNEMDLERRIKFLEEENRRLIIEKTQITERVNIKEIVIDKALEEKIKSLEILLASKNSEIEELSIKYSNLSAIYEKQLLTSNKKEISILEEKISILTGDLKRVNGLYQNTLLECTELKKMKENQNYHLEEISIYKQRDNENLIIISNLNAKIEELRNKCLILERELSFKPEVKTETRTIYVKDDKEYQDKIQILLEEIEVWKSKFNNKEINTHSHSLTIVREKELISSIEKFSNEVVIWKNKAMKLEIEIEDIKKKEKGCKCLKRKSKIKKLKEKIEELKSKAPEEKIIEYRECECKKQIHFYLKEINDLKILLSKKEYHEPIIVQNNSELYIMKEEINNLKKVISEKESEIYILKQKKTDESTISIAFINEIDNWRRKVVLLEEKINSLNIEISNKTNIINNMKIEKESHNIHSSTIKNVIIKGKDSEFLNIEIMRLQKLLREKNHEIEMLKSTKQVIKNSDIIKYEETIALLKRQIEEWKSKMSETSIKIIKNENHHSSDFHHSNFEPKLKEETFALKEIIRKLTLENENWRVKYLALEEDIGNFARSKHYEKEKNVSSEKNGKQIITQEERILNKSVRNRSFD